MGLKSDIPFRFVQSLSYLTKANCTCNKVGFPVINVHQAVGTGIGQAPKWVPLQFLPWWLSDANIIVLHPALVGMVVDVGPIMTCWCLAFMDEHGMESVGYLIKSRVGDSIEPSLYKILKPSNIGIQYPNTEMWLNSKFATA